MINPPQETSMKDISKAEVDERVGQLAEAISKAFDDCIGRRAVTEETLASLCAILRRAAPHADDDNLRFAVGASPDEIVPANLYTALRMTYGIDAPSWETCEDGAWTAPNGMVFEWKDGATRIHVAQPLHRITCGVEVTLPEMHIVSYSDTCWILDEGTTGRPIMGAGPFIKYFGSADEAQGAIDEFVGKGYEGEFNIRPTPN